MLRETNIGTVEEKKSLAYKDLSMNSLPPQRRPGVFVNMHGEDSLREETDRFSGSDSTTTSQTGCSRGRGKLMETVLALVKYSTVGKKDDPMPFQYNSNSSACQCDREKKNILCQACGHHFMGRVRTRCPCHPTVIHLMDLEACPNCLATHLKEFSTTQKRCP